jgi:dienelactone hydrolase
MTRPYPHLGPFSDWVDEAHRQRPLYPAALPGPETQTRVRDLLGFYHGDEQPHDVRVERRWARNGIVGEEVSWWVGYGPRTYAYVLKPAGVSQRLPGLLALHDHGGFKFYGKEKIADGPDGRLAIVQSFRADCYGGRAFANELAREGFVVVVHDTILWGSRRFPLEIMLSQIAGLSPALVPASDDPDAAIHEYNAAALQHELIFEKTCNLLGTTMAGVVSHEDRIAFNYLGSRLDVDPMRRGCIGLSGGGNRAALLQATHDEVRAAVIVGLMCTYAELVGRLEFTHTWMLYPHGLPRFSDWPDLAGCRAPSPLLVQYDLEDELFTEPGMRAADRRLAEIYGGTGHPEAYEGQFYPGPHKFDLEMQAAAFSWLRVKL